MTTKTVNKETATMGALDKIVQSAPKRDKSASTQVSTKLAPGAYAAIRQASVQSGMSMSEIVKSIIHDTLAADGVNVDEAPDD